MWKCSGTLSFCKLVGPKNPPKSRRGSRNLALILYYFGAPQLQSPTTKATPTPLSEPIVQLPETLNLDGDSIKRGLKEAARLAIPSIM